MPFDGSDPQLPPPGKPPGDLGGKLRDLRDLVNSIQRDLDQFGPDPVDDVFIPPWKKPVMEKPSVLERVGSGVVPALLRSVLWIEGVELTQAIQFFNYAGQGSRFGADNSVPLVADKETIVRVYAGPGLMVWGSVRYTGRLRIGDRTYAPLNGVVTASASAPARRGQLNDTLNFRLPGWECRGKIKFAVELWRENQNVLYEVKSDVSAEFAVVPRMKLTGVLVRFTGNGQNLAAPSGKDLVDTLSRFLPMLPTPGYDYNVCTVVDYAGDLTVKKGWDDLLTLVTNMRNASTVRTYYCGLLPANTPGIVSATTRGIGNWGVAVGARDDSRALVHEFGHALQLEHLNACGAPAPWDPNFPKYPTGSTNIGEFGVDIKRLVVFDPATTTDLMTYCDNPAATFPPATWVSPYHYKKMMDALTFSDGTGDYIKITVVIATVVGSPFMLLNFRVHREGRVEIRPSYVLSGAVSGGDPRTLTPVTVDVLDAAGEVIASHRCHQHNPYQDPHDAYLDYCEVVPWPTKAAQVRFVRREQVLDTLKMGRRGPQVSLRGLERVSRGGDLARLRWSAPAGAESLVRYTSDGGRNWIAVGAALTRGELLLDLDVLPGGDDCRLQILTSTGLGSTTVETESFVVPRKRRTAYIFSPRDGETFRAGCPVSFTGGGHSPDHGTSTFEEVTWTSGLHGTLGSGYQVTRDDLRPGLHRISMSVPDGEGGEAVAHVSIRVVEESQPRC